jgi:hypothetical protein
VASVKAASQSWLAFREDSKDLGTRQKRLFRLTYEEQVELARLFRDDYANAIARCRGEALRIKSLPGLDEFGLRLLNNFNAEIQGLEQFLSMANISTALPSRKQ